MHPKHWAAVAACGLFALASAASYADTIHIGLAAGDSVVSISRDMAPGDDPVQASVDALLAGPTAEEKAAGLLTYIPAGTTLVKFEQSADSVTVDLSLEVLQGFGEYQLQQIFDQFRVTLNSFDWIMSIRLTCQNQLLSTYLQPAPVIQSVAPKETPPILTSGLGGRNITIGPSHGRYYNGSAWYWQRSDPCGFGEAVLEDTNSIRLMQFLYQYLSQDGATVHVCRELNESNCCNSSTGLAWWKMASRYWLQTNGLPSSVWNSSDTDLNDDIRARPLFADYRGSDIYLACHTNAGGGGTANGTETFRDTAMAYPAHETNSYNLALAIQNNVINTIREMYDSGWANRGVKDSAGGFGEIRIPNRPAILIELGFHDNCSRDAAYLTDNFFRSLCEWALYKGVCEYFGSSPTWDKYSDEYVSDTIPTTMTQGQTYNVAVTFRNRGVVWSDGRSFRLGANGESDPFTSFTRVNISGEVRPGSNYTFNFQMTAPAAGDYVSDWRMVRDGVTWFGPTLSKNIHVAPNIVDTDPPTVPTNLVANATGATTVQLTWTASTDNVGVNGYQIRRNGSVIGTSTTNSYTDNSAPAGSVVSYDVRAYDSVPNYSAYCTPASTTTPTAPVLVFSDGFNGNLNNWTQQSQNFDYSTSVNHGTYTGDGAAYCNAGGTDQMYRQFARPFAQGRAWGYFWDAKGGWKQGTCGNQYRQALSLRDTNNAALMFIDNELYSPIGNSTYAYRVIGTGAGGAHTAFGTRDAGTDCNGTWIFFETTVNAAAPGGVPSLVLRITDRAGTNTATPGMPTNFYDNGIGRITLGLGAASTNECWWDDVAFEANPPGPPSMSAPTPAATAITWNFSRADNNLFGYEVADASGTILSPTYANTGWLTRTATSWTESGLAANTQYTRKVRGWNGTLDGGFSATQSAYTLSPAPGVDSVSIDRSSACPGQDITFTAVGGFGAGAVQYYKYAWDQEATHTFNGSEPSWSSDTLTLQQTVGGATWYLHVQGYNAQDVANGTFDYAVPISTSVAPDFDHDCDVDEADFTHFALCATGANAGPLAPGCQDADFDNDEDVDQSDFGVFQRCCGGENVPADLNCVN